jgi:hypothetical protein
MLCGVTVRSLRFGHQPRELVMSAYRMGWRVGHSFWAGGHGSGLVGRRERLGGGTRGARAGRDPAVAGQVRWGDPGRAPRLQVHVDPSR